MKTNKTNRQASLSIVFELNIIVYTLSLSLFVGIDKEFLLAAKTLFYKMVICMPANANMTGEEIFRQFVVKTNTSSQ